MSFWERLGEILQTPQSALTGATLGLMRDYGQGPEWAEDIAPDAQNPIAGFLAGLQGGMKPSAVLKPDTGDSLISKIANSTLDVGYDPLMLLGAAPAGSKVGNVATKFLGPAAERAPGVSRLSADALQNAITRATGLTYKGTLGSEDSNVLEGFGIGMLGGAGERVARRTFPAIWGRLARLADGAADDIPSAVQTAGGGLARQGEQIAGAAPKARGQGFFPDVDGPIAPDRIFAGAIPERTSGDLMELLAGRQPMGALNPGSAIPMPSGPRPMGRVISDFIPQSRGNFLDELANEAVEQAIPRAVGTPGSEILGPRTISDVLIDPTLTGQARDDYVLNALEQILRNNR